MGTRLLLRETRSHAWRIYENCSVANGEDALSEEEKTMARCQSCWYYSQEGGISELTAEVSGTYRYQLCIVLNDSRAAEPSIDLVMGRFGPRSDELVPWNVTSGIHLQKSTIRLLGAYVCMLLFGHELEVNKELKFHHHEFIVDPLSEQVFENIRKAIHANSKQERSQLSAMLENTIQFFRSSDMPHRYQVQPHLCAAEQIQFIGCPAKEEEGKAVWLIDASFRRRDTKRVKWFSILRSHYMGACDVFVCDKRLFAREVLDDEFQDRATAKASTYALRSISLAADSDADSRDVLFHFLCRCATDYSVRLSSSEVSRVRTAFEKSVSNAMYTPEVRIEGWRPRYVLGLRQTIAEEVRRDSEGLVGIEEVYEVQLMGRKHRRSSPSDDNAEADKKHIPAHQLLLNAGKAIVIAGTPGAGKTTALRHLAWKTCNEYFADESNPIPLFLRCRRGSLLMQLRDAFCASGLSIENDDDALNELGRMDCRIFIDDLDDLQAEEHVEPKEILRLLGRTTERSQIFITTRLTHLPELGQELNYIVCVPQHPSLILHRYGVAADRAQSIVKDMTVHRTLEILSTPMFLMFVALVEEYSLGLAPMAQGKLIGMMVQRFFFHRESQKSRWKALSPSVTADDVACGLSAVAYRVVEQGPPWKISVRAAEEILCQYLETQRHMHLDAGLYARSILMAGQYSSLLLLRAAEQGSHIEFKHDVYKDYFAALYLQEYKADPTIITKTTGWLGVLQMLSGMAPSELKREYLVSYFQNVTAVFQMASGIIFLRQAQDICDQDPVFTAFLQAAESLTDNEENMSPRLKCLAALGTPRSASTMCTIAVKHERFIKYTLHLLAEVDHRSLSASDLDRICARIEELQPTTRYLKSWMALPDFKKQLLAEVDCIREYAKTGIWPEDLKALRVWPNDYGDDDPGLDMQHNDLLEILPYYLD